MTVQNLLSPIVPWFDPETGLPTPDFLVYMRELDKDVRRTLHSVERDFTFADDGKTLDVGYLPEGAQILRPISGIEVSVPFNAGSGNVADLGPSTNPDLWATDLALGTVGFKPIDEGVSVIVGPGEGLTQLTVDLTGTAATTGVGRAIVCYIIPIIVT